MGTKDNSASTKQHKVPAIPAKSSIYLYVTQQRSYLHCNACSSININAPPEASIMQTLVMNLMPFVNKKQRGRRDPGLRVLTLPTGHVQNNSLLCVRRT